MTVPTWTALHAYTAGALVNPTVANGHSFICTATGTSGAAEPAWSGRYPAVVDASTAWAPYTVVTPAQIRAQMNWGASAGQYTDDIIGNYLLDAISALEQKTGRYIVNRPGATVTYTSMVRATLPLPALRNVTSVTYAGTLLPAPTTSQGGPYWLLPDAQQSGVFTGIQFRAFRATDQGPWWLADPLWFDKSLDSPFYPGNYGGGFVFTSMPNDTIVVGDYGWEPLFEPGAAVHAIEVLGAFFSLRAPTLLAESAITPQGGIVSYAAMPAEVRDFIAQWSAGAQVVSIG